MEQGRVESLPRFAVALGMDEGRTPRPMVGGPREVPSRW
ncbi:hypothetical protein F4561_005320 [Lipingzhangella halophila]|uniref:Uncharacterized protein n=1 Tax=Lipingzhangella halophila TaxID=1783352 RepID=A0A7W7W645_9ACTN|nr:hypothetical protein [Lipingzhangella halophila]